jgi:prolipoprotein diacylglyceryltransferase
MFDFAPSGKTNGRIGNFIPDCYNGGPLKKPCKSAPNFRTGFHQT